jgi:photosystem II stability/assembly factor-like uncharacterized protein
VVKKIALIIILLACSFQTQAQWVYKMSLINEMDNYLGGIVFNSPKTGFYWTNWNTMHQGSYTLYRTTDGWNTFKNIGGESGVDSDKPHIFTMTFLNDTLGFRVAGSIFSRLEKTIDQGNTWTRLDNHNESWGTREISFISIDNGYLLNTTNGTNIWIYIYYNGIFQKIELPTDYRNYHRMHFTDEASGFIFCRDRINTKYYCLRTADSANTWTPVLESQNLDFKAISFPSREVGYVLAPEGVLFKTTDAGNHWQTLNIGDTTTMNSMYFINDTLGYIAGNSGRILKTRNGGNSWNPENSGVTTPIQKIYMSDTTQGFFLSGVKVYGKSIVGISDHYSPEFFIYPNPAHESIHVSFLNSDSPAKLSIYSLDGLKVFELDNYISGESIYTDDLLKGVYILSLTDKKGTGNRKFIKE